MALTEIQKSAYRTSANKNGEPAMTQFYTYLHSSEHRANMSAALTGKKHPIEFMQSKGMLL